MDQTRRRFLRTTGLGVIGGGLGLSLPGVGYGFGGSASFLPVDWSDPAYGPGSGPCANPSGVELPAIPTLPPPGKRVLEIVLYGGLSPWETFWVAAGGSDTFVDVDSSANVQVDMKGAGDLVKYFDWCNTYPGPQFEYPQYPDRVKEFGLDDSENMIYWGPATAPLWTDEIMSSARMITFGHYDGPHELCMPIALTGLKIGNSRGAGLGAAISKAYREQSGCVDANRPYAYVLTPENFGHFGGITASIFATGSHGGANRPVELPVGTSGLGELFLESQPDPAPVAALRALREQYGRRLRWQGDPDAVVRSPQFDDYRTSTATLENSSSLHDLLGGDVLKAEYGSTCMGEFPANTDTFDGTNITAKALQVAGDLLDPNQGNARYVGVMDRGFNTFGFAPYDSHEAEANADLHIPMTLGNLYNCLFHLRKEIDLGRINLDDTLVVLTTEMGRDPNLGPDYQGREHWPYGIVQVLLGNPGKQGIAGTIDEYGYARTAPLGMSYESKHARAAILKVAGVEPISPDIFQASELKDQLAEDDSEYDATKLSDRLGEVILGLGEEA